jgi:hypothetical protein
MGEALMTLPAAATDGTATERTPHTDPRLSD